MKRSTASPLPCGGMRNGITTIAATPADAAAETADSTASLVTAITSVPAAAAITASGERANISFVSSSVEPDVFRKRFHREPLHQLRWFPFPKEKAYYQITPRTDIVTTFVRGFFCPNRKTPCWRKAGCREEYADNTTLCMVPPMKLSMEWNSCAAKFNGNNAFRGNRLVEINAIFPRRITLVGE